MHRRASAFQAPVEWRWPEANSGLSATDDTLPTLENGVVSVVSVVSAQADIAPPDNKEHTDDTHDTPDTQDNCRECVVSADAGGDLLDRAERIAREYGDDNLDDLKFNAAEYQRQNGPAHPAATHCRCAQPIVADGGVCAKCGHEVLGEVAA